MKVGILFEGTFPYVPGGVSSWGNSLMKGLDDIEFVVIHVGANPERRLPKYKFPKNVVDYFEFFLFADYKWNKPPISEIAVKDITKTINYPFDEKYMSEKLYDVLCKHYDYDFTTVTESKFYWQFISALYQKFIPYENFNYYYWNIRSMLLPFLNALTIDIPVCDLYHSVTTGYSGLVAMMAGIKYKKPYIITEHGIYHRERQLDLLRASWVKDEYRLSWIKLFNTISAMTYYGATAVTTLFLKNQIIEMELCDEYEKMSIITNGVDFDNFSKLEKRTEKDPFIIGLVGRVVEIKDIKTAIKAIRLVKEKVHNIKFHIIGPYDEEPEYYKQCVELIEVFEMRDTVFFEGMVNVNEWYPKLNLTLLSSVSEGQPLALLESMAAGLPFVATDVGSCYEIAYGLDTDEDVPGHCGIVVKPKNFVKMSEAILEFYNNEKLYNEASEVAVKRVKKRYTTEKMFSEYKKCYLQVVEKYGRDRLQAE